MKHLKRCYGVDFYRASGAGRVAVHQDDFLTNGERFMHNEHIVSDDYCEQIATERAAKCGFKRSRILDVYTIKASNLLRVGRMIWQVIRNAEIDNFLKGQSPCFVI